MTDEMGETPMTDPIPYRRDPMSNAYQYLDTKADADGSAGLIRPRLRDINEIIAAMGAVADSRCGENSSPHLDELIARLSAGTTVANENVRGH